MIPKTRVRGWRRRIVFGAGGLIFAGISLCSVMSGKIQIGGRGVKMPPVYEREEPAKFWTLVCGCSICAGAGGWGAVAGFGEKRTSSRKGGGGR